MSSAEPISSTSAIETSSTTSTDLAISCRNPVPARLLPSFSDEFKSVREAANAGNNPNRTPVRSETASVNPSSRQSRPMPEPSSPMRGSPAGLTASSARTPAKPNASPSTPPAIASIMLSVKSWRTIRVRLAPSAARMANSRLRPVARTSSRLATLAHAINSTNATAPSRISNDRRESATIESRNSSTANPPLGFGIAYRRTN